MPQATTVPEISVLMPAYNAQAYIRQSVQSVLGQTFEDFELLVVNDGSTDMTRDILAAFDDPRLRIIDNPRNLGIVGTLNHGLTMARGQYIARIDADDICLPHRFARQKAFLDVNPQTVIVTTEMAVLEDGNVTFTREGGDTDPAIVEWLLHLGNPLGHTSMMFRADEVATMGTYLREEFTYAEDFDFSHRMLRYGEISVLPDHLVIYRKHLTNLTRTRRSTMIERTARVLRGAYARLLGPGSDADADLVTEHMIARAPFPDDATLLRLAQFLPRLIAAFADSHQLSAERRARVQEATGRAWWRMIQAVLRGGQVGTALRHRNAFPSPMRPRLREIARAAAVGFATTHLRIARPSKTGVTPLYLPAVIDDVSFQPVPPIPGDPPTLYVVVNTGSEYDGAKGGDRPRTSVSALRQQEPAQHVFDSWGVRPIYLVDYPVASQPEGYEPLREILARHGCVIGALMHPWVTPPFDETLSEHNSYEGNLSRDLEERKLHALVAAIERNFGVTPLFFRAGHHGVGPNTMDLLAKLGFHVDFSLMPHTDLRPHGGPDFRLIECVPYRVGAGSLLSVPVTRGQIGALASMPPRLQTLLQPLAGRLRTTSVLTRLHLASTVTLTPEGVSAAAQVQLIDDMMYRGCRTFVLHYHSPSLAKQTPYVNSEIELGEFIARIETVCQHFFAVRGGLPGNPADLLPPGQRGRVWPAPAAVAKPAVG